MKSISVIIPNYNGEALLKENLPYIFNALESSNISNFEIIIPDDNSSDNSIQFIEEYYSDIILVKNKVNKGFSGNTNSGILKATKDLLFIVNTDVQLTKNYFTPLLHYFDKDDTFGVMGRIVSIDEKEHQDAAKYPGYSFGNIISTENYFYETNEPIYSFFLSGANSLVDRKKMSGLGNYNELFNPYYSEDADLGFRAWRKGFKLYYENKSVCKHPNSVTIQKEPSDKVKRITKRNKIYLHFLHLNGFELKYYLFILTIKAHFNLIIGKKSYYNSYKEFKSNKVKLIKYKNNFEQSNLVTKRIKEVANFIKGNIDSQNLKRF